MTSTAVLVVTTYSVMAWVAMVAVGDDYGNDNNGDDDTDSREEDYILRYHNNKVDGIKRQ
jgi:hypothetical protein